MADAIAQARWRKRSQAGLIQKLSCPQCGKPLKSNSKEICRICWLQTAKGKEYTRQKTARYRAKATA